ncbi:MAG: hypothetical protein KBB20_05920 [Bacteroidales bacterium]|jgi:hypothetical protein|nr:hypothetical protein [Bacteroidales bacterium]HOH23701.1 hypothetical protein [Bacteroidales bacterium]HPY58689.1 hypothetical protein [Bacteroidales bacterium]HQB70967.1 hypothetical protein [Bacteroidales bacterium]HQN87852.1 hypothetical protein [Bacteroidales bacterium]
MYYVVKYSGPFGFIKPWTAVRDSETYSQQFLTPSIIEGIEKKLFPELLHKTGKILKIVRYRLNYCGIDMQQERTRSKGEFEKEKKTDSLGRTYYTAKNMGVITRGVLLQPNLYLAFKDEQDANNAFAQTICLCRNEDLLFPEILTEMSEEDFDKIDGFELETSSPESGFKVGYNRFDDFAEMFGELKVVGNPIRDR